MFRKVMQHPFSGQRRVGPESTGHAPSNPFSTCHIRPGAMPFLYRAGEDANLARQAAQ